MLPIFFVSGCSHCSIPSYKCITLAPLLFSRWMVRRDFELVVLNKHIFFHLSTSLTEIQHSECHESVRQLLSLLDSLFIISTTPIIVINHTIGSLLNTLQACTVNNGNTLLIMMIMIMICFLHTRSFSYKLFPIARIARRSEFYSLLLSLLLLSHPTSSPDFIRRISHAVATILSKTVLTPSVVATPSCFN